MIFMSNFYNSPQIVPKTIKIVKKSASMMRQTPQNQGFLILRAYGGGGSRTPVRKPVGKNFYHHSWFLVIPFGRHKPTSRQPRVASWVLFTPQSLSAKVLYLSMPDSQAIDDLRPTAALIKPQMRNFCCRFF